MNTIKVLIVDDSAVTRKLLNEALSRSKAIEVVGTALDPYIAVNKIKNLHPDVLTLDIEMPRMDGITFLSKLMISQPMPVVMVSSLTDNGAKATVKALELGAIDFILKPNIDDEDSWESFSEELIEKVIIAGKSKVKRKNLDLKPASHISDIKVSEKYTADVILSKKNLVQQKISKEAVIAIGASTGGTEVIAEILRSLPNNVPGILIVQHMPEKFTKVFADRVNGISRLYVKEAEHGDRLYQGMVLVAPGNYHMLLRNDSEGYWVEINDGPPVNRHRPAVDVLFRSFAQIAGKNSAGFLLTGMGNDGAAGLLEIKEAGLSTIAQDEESSVVFGMPAEAIKIGAADMVMNISSAISYIGNMAS
ncbi:MAG: chemotaxis response regulator protein-glutamate methylesterase [Spirochaetota bacterium]|nr:chemotaxis response regulator protein-glutamate methylesterase [Spirochaetota bacterium]